MAERIAKFMARSGVCSRREAEEIIKQKRVTVNGETIESPVFNVSGDEKYCWMVKNCPKSSKQDCGYTISRRDF